MNQNAGNKTEKATPKKRRDAREKGQVLKSNEVIIAICSVAMIGTLAALWPSITNQLTRLLRDFLNPSYLAGVTKQLDTPVVQGLLLTVLLRFGEILVQLNQ